MRFSEVDYKTDDVNSLDELSSKTTTIPSDPFPLGFDNLRYLQVQRVSPWVTSKLAHNVVEQELASDQYLDFSDDIIRMTSGCNQYCL